MKVFLPRRFVFTLRLDTPLYGAKTAPRDNDSSLTKFLRVTREIASIQNNSMIYPPATHRAVVGTREKCSRTNQTAKCPFQDANNESQPAGAGSGAHPAPLGAALGLLRLATMGW